MELQPHVDVTAKALASPDEVKYIALLLQQFYGEKLQALASLQRLDTIAQQVMHKFVTDESVKIRSDFVGSIDQDYLNKKVHHASIRIFWLHLLH